MQDPTAQVPTRIIEFPYLDGLELTIRPAVLDLNPLYVVACSAWLSPLKLAGELPDDHPRALTDARAEAALAKAYALAVVWESNKPAHEAYGPDDWEAWLLENPQEFRSLQTIAPVRTNFVDEPHQVEPSTVGALLATPNPADELAARGPDDG
jgi:hypothetical protein